MEGSDGDGKGEGQAEGNANEEHRLQRTPTKRMRYTDSTSPSVRAANATRSKYRRLRASPLNATARKQLLAKLNRDKSNSQSKIIPGPSNECEMNIL